MAVFKCSMCGGNLISTENGLGVCDSCGLTQSLTETVRSTADGGFEKFISNTPKKTNADASESIEPLVKRMFLFLEDGKWQNADEYCEKILDTDPEYAPAYLGKLMTEYRVTKPEYLSNLSLNFETSGSFQKAMRYGDDTMKESLTAYLNQARKNIETRSVQEKLTAASVRMKGARTFNDFTQAAELFRQVGDYANAPQLAEECLVKAEEKRCENIYNAALKAAAKGDAESLKTAIEGFRQIPSFKDSAERAQKCEAKLSRSASTAKIKTTAQYIALAVFIIAKFICSAKWATYLDKSIVISDVGTKAWLHVLLQVISLMPVEVVLTSIVSIIASHCRIKKFRIGGIIMFVLTVFESFMMSTISCQQMFGEKFSKIFLFYFIFSIICNFTVYIIMLIVLKIKNSVTK